MPMEENGFSPVISEIEAAKAFWIFVSEDPNPRGISGHVLHDLEVDEVFLHRRTAKST
jgi:hypothetical protein